MRLWRITEADFSTPASRSVEMTVVVLACCVCDEFCDHGGEGCRSAELLCAGIAEVDPAGVEGVDHLGARFGAAFGHALCEEGCCPLIAWNGDGFDGMLERRSEGCCDVAW